MAYTLRVSVTDNCQLRCRYCLPNGPHHLVPRHNYLSVAHYERAARILSRIAIDKLRFTGGEPLLRKDLPGIIGAFARHLNKPLAVTTNGLLFLGMHHALRDAGLSGVTFHLDTLKEERYQTLMGKGTVHTVREAMDAARASALVVKINVVVQKGVNDDELVDFLHFSRSHGIEVRFIEQMNTGLARDYVAQTFMSGEAILARIAKATPITEHARLVSSTPAERHRADDIGVDFGLIASDTRPFCGACNRLRMSADGRMRTCLYESGGVDVGFMGELGDDAILANICDVIAHKRSFHPSQKIARVDFAMAQIGG